MSQQESDEMKIKYNLLYQENDELKSQVDILHKKLKQNRKLVEKYRERKDKKEDDTKEEGLVEENVILHEVLENTDKVRSNFEKDIVNKEESLKRKEELELQKTMYKDEIGNLQGKHKIEEDNFKKEIEIYKAKLADQEKIDKSDLEKSTKDKYITKLENDLKNYVEIEKLLKRQIQFKDANINQKRKYIESLEKNLYNDRFNYDIHWYPYLPLPTKLIQPSVAIVKDKVYVTSGYELTTPHGMALEDYLMGKKKTFCFHLAKCHCDIIDSPVHLGALVSMNGQCVLVSGVDSVGNTLTGNLYVLYEKGFIKWNQSLPTPRILMYACCYGNQWLIVCGGYKTKLESSLLEAVNLVEILDITKGKWYILPKQNCPNFSTILCCAVVGEDVYVVGSDQVIKTSCNKLIKAATSNSTLVWDNVQIGTEESNEKLYPFSVVEVNGEPMIIASMTDGEDDVTCVLMKDTRGRWRIMSKAVECQHCSGAVVTSSLELLLFGGSTEIKVNKATEMSQKCHLIPTLNIQSKLLNVYVNNLLFVTLFLDMLSRNNFSGNPLEL